MAKVFPDQAVHLAILQIWPGSCLKGSKPDIAREYRKYVRLGGVT